MTKVREVQVSGSRMVELLDGGQYRRAEKLLAEMAETSSPMRLVLRAEIEIYFARLEEAAQLLNQVQSCLDDIHLAARYAMTRGSLHYWRYEYNEADEHFQTAYHIYKLTNDSFNLASALCSLGRLRRRKGEFKEAGDLLAKARELLKGESPEHIERFEFLAGLIDFNVAVCRHEMGDLESASSLYHSSIELLRRSEECRYYGLALNSYGSLLVRLGRYQEALEPLQAANRIFTELATLEDLNHSRSNLAWALIRLKNYGEAEELLKDGIELAHRVGDIASTSVYLRLFAELNLMKGDVGGARRSVDSAIEQADLSSNIGHQASSRILGARISLAKGDAYNAEQALNTALELAQKSGNQSLEARARLYLADTLVTTSSVKGREYLNKACDLLANYREAALDQDVKRISDRYRGERVTITADNKLMINGNLLPTWNTAKEAVERFLLKNALEQAQDNQTKAGQILGITKVHVHDKRKQYGL